jgi:hypothetical protein
MQPSIFQLLVCILLGYTCRAVNPIETNDVIDGQSVRRRVYGVQSVGTDISTQITKNDLVSLNSEADVEMLRLLHVHQSVSGDNSSNVRIM